jgi:hypothetical protein
VSVIDRNVLMSPAIIMDFKKNNIFVLLDSVDDATQDLMQVRQPFDHCDTCLVK